MGLVNTLGRLFKAKSEGAAEKIEDAHMLEFAAQTIRDMEGDFASAQENYKKVKGELISIERHITEQNAKLDTRKSQAKALKDQGNLELAQKIAAECIQIMHIVEGYEQQKKSQMALLEQQKKNVEDLGEHLEQAKRDHEYMKSQEIVLKSTESLTKIDHAGVNSALGRFERYKEIQQKKLDVATAGAEVVTASNLDAQVEAALGTKHTAANDFLNSL
jgi:phage shock protein A